MQEPAKWARRLPLVITQQQIWIVRQTAGAGAPAPPGRSGEHARSSHRSCAAVVARGRANAGLPAARPATTTCLNCRDAGR